MKFTRASHVPSHHPCSHRPADCVHCGLLVTWQTLAEETCPSAPRPDCWQCRYEKSIGAFDLHGKGDPIDLCHTCVGLWGPAQTRDTTWTLHPREATP